MDKNCKNLYSKLKIFDLRFLMEGAELIDTTSNSMDRLLQYLDTNLTTLHDNLNEDNFERILFVIWDILSESLYQLVHNNLEVRYRETYNILSLSVFFPIFFKQFQLSTEKETTIVLLEPSSHIAHPYSIL